MDIKNKILRPSPIVNPHKFINIDDLLIDEKYIKDKIDSFENILEDTISQINKVATNWLGKKSDWDNIYLLQLCKINNDITSFLKLLKHRNVKIMNKENEKKLDAVINKCFTIMLIGDGYFPN